MENIPDDSEKAKQPEDENDARGSPINDGRLSHQLGDVSPINDAYLDVISKMRSIHPHPDLTPSSHQISRSIHPQRNLLPTSSQFNNRLQKPSSDPPGQFVPLNQFLKQSQMGSGEKLTKKSGGMMAFNDFQNEFPYGRFRYRSILEPYGGGVNQDRGLFVHTKRRFGLDGFHDDAFTQGFGDFSTMKKKRLNNPIKKRYNNGKQSTYYSVYGKRYPGSSAFFGGDTFTQGFGDFQTMKKRFPEDTKSHSNIIFQSRNDESEIVPENPILNKMHRIYA